MKLLTKFNVIFDHTIKFLAYLAGVVIVFMMLSVFTDVTARKLFSMPQVWVLEICEYSILYVTFLSAAWLLKEEGHVRMDLLVSRLRPRNQALLNGAMSIVGAIMCLVVAWYGARVTWDVFERGLYVRTMLATPMAPLLAIIPLGSFLLFIQFLKRAYGCLVGRKVVIKPEAEGMEL